MGMHTIKVLKTQEAFIDNDGQIKPSGAGLIQPISDQLPLQDILQSTSEDAEVGELFLLSIAEMTKDEIDNLPEFDGF